jgi:hypothetical protein
MIGSKDEMKHLKSTPITIWTLAIELQMKLTL